MEVPGVQVSDGEQVDAASDDELMQAIARQDAAALVALYDRYGRLAFGLAYRIVNDGPLGEEIVQDAFMQVWRRAATYRTNQGGNVRAWLMTIVHHRAIDMIRRAGGNHAQDVPLDDAGDLVAGTDVWREVSARLTQDEVRAAVAALPPEQREAIGLAYFEGLSQSEIAERLHAPLGTVKGRMRLGLKKLYDALVETAERVAPGEGHGA